MANLVKKGNTFVVRFRFGGKEYKKSLKTSCQKDAAAAQRSVEVTIHRLLTGQLAVPVGIDAGDFIVSGGTLQPEVEVPVVIFPTTRALIESYLEGKRKTISETYLASQKTHLGHLKRFLGEKADLPCNHVTQQHLEQYLFGRREIRDPETVTRERVTLLQFYKWVGTRQDVPQFPSPIVALPTFKSSKDRDRFRTVAEIEAIIERGGLNDEQAADAWECLYLSPTEIGGLLEVVRQNARDPMSFLLHAIPAYTGMRRGEIMRLQWLDVDLDRDYITARSRKQSRNRTETKRQIDLHAELKQHLQEWRRQRPKGQWVISDSKSLEPLSPDDANRLFRQPMRGTSWRLSGSRNWFKIGFHTYRHSFASNLACLGVDQRIIDKWMGHTTEEIRERYQHLFPETKKSAMEFFSLATASGTLVVEA